MAIIYMVEDLFTDQLLEKKWEMVKEHFESAYKIKFKSRPAKEKIDHLYKEMMKLSRTEFTYKK